MTAASRTFIASILTALMLALPTISWGQTARQEPAPVSYDVPLSPGGFRWIDDAPDDPPVIVVSLSQQRLFVYRGGVLVGVTTISSGRRGHSTPRGEFTILQKARFHRSNIYSNAPMPFMQRLTWGGIALHAGHNPGYPASHGCIRLPFSFARDLYAITRIGGLVMVDVDPSPPPYLDLSGLRYAIADDDQLSWPATPSLDYASDVFLAG